MSRFLQGLNAGGPEEASRRVSCKKCEGCQEDADRPKGVLVFKFASNVDRLKEIVKEYVDSNEYVKKCIEECLKCAQKSINVNEDDHKLGLNTALEIDRRRKAQKEKIDANTKLLQQRAAQELAASKQREKDILDRWDD